MSSFFFSVRLLVLCNNSQRTMHTCLIIKKLLDLLILHEIPIVTARIRTICRSLFIYKSNEASIDFPSYFFFLQLIPFKKN